MVHFNEENRQHCSGCTACLHTCPQQCIQMQADDEGFLYPVADIEKCINCGLCDEVCPVQHRPALGGEPTAVALRSNDENVLRHSASGGACTPLAEYIIASGGKVFGAVFDENFSVVHRGVDAPKDVPTLRGSKYVQSDLGGIFPQVAGLLGQGRPVLFFGTPCQVAGLKKYIGREDENLYCVDLVCFGVPSPKLWQSYLNWQRATHSSAVKTLTFREKTYGYHSGCIVLTFENGKTYRGSGRTDYMMKSFYSKIASRPACYSCAFKSLRRESDLTLFDCWNFDKLVPGTKDDDKGYTAVLVHTSKGQSLLDKVRHLITAYPVDVTAAVGMDGTMVACSNQPHPQRERFYKLFVETSLVNAVNNTLPIRRSDYFIEKSKRIFYALGLTRLLVKISRKS